MHRLCYAAFLLWVLPMSMSAEPPSAQVPIQDLEPMTVGEEIPEEIYGDPLYYDAPVWVSATSVETVDGQVDWGLLGSAAKTHYQTILSNPPRLIPGPEGGWVPDLSMDQPLSQCVYYGKREAELTDPPSRADLAAFVTDSDAVFRGEIVGLAEGFFHGRPGTLAKVRIRQVYKNSAEYDFDRSVLIHYPKAAFEIGQTSFCKGDPRYPLDLDLGDEIYFFTYAGKEQTEELIFPALYGEPAIFKKSTGQRLLPEVVEKSLSVDSVEGVAVDVQSELHQSLLSITSKTSASHAGLEDPVYFDLDADGEVEEISWTARLADEAFLAFDRNWNGRIDDGTELFGGVTPQPASDDPNGFRALALFDQLARGGNADGWITPEDRIFEHLRLWLDENHDGESQPFELHPLKSVSITGLELRYIESRRKDRHGNLFRWAARARFGRQLRLSVVDVILLSH